MYGISSEFSKLYKITIIIMLPCNNLVFTSLCIRIIIHHLMRASRHYASKLCVVSLDLGSVTKEYVGIFYTNLVRVGGFQQSHDFLI